MSENLRKSLKIFGQSFSEIFKEIFSSGRNRTIIRTFTLKESERRKQISHSFVIDRNDSEIYGF